MLWHMKREVDLANLSHEAVQLDWHSPQAWVVMGNCFSLQKVHEDPELQILRLQLIGLHCCAQGSSGVT